MIRYIIFFGFLYLAYKLIKKWVQQTLQENIKQTHSTSIETMVKDPCCGVYLPQSEAIKMTIKGKTEYFCSKQCRDKYKLVTH